MRTQLGSREWPTSGADGGGDVRQDQLFKLELCQPMDQRCQWVNGDFGMSPFRGQLSGKPLPARPYVSGVLERIPVTWKHSLRA